MRRTALAGLSCLLCLSPLASRAEEGMWTFDGFPSEEVERSHGFRPDEAWLARARLASVRLAQGCSGSFVSASGLVMTNHHCASSCIEQLSTAGQDLMRDGFLASGPAEERRCPNLEVNQLVEISDVTARVQQVTAGLTGEAFSLARRAEKARIEKACQRSDEVRCEVVTLYQGGRYQLYRYRRWQDVRLVFAPEHAIASFGGDPDNFMFPRWDLDVAFLRVYADGAALASPDHFRWSPAGPREGELTFVSGHPGHTSRQLTAAQLAFQRDVELPALLVHFAEWRGRLVGYRARGPEEAREADGTLQGVENRFKVWSGRWRALTDPAFFQKKLEEEARLRAALARDQARAARALPAFDAIAGAVEAERALYRPYLHLESRRGFSSELFWIARTLVRAADELPKPGEQRLPELSDAALPATTQRLFSPAPLHPGLETLKLAFSLDKLREALGPDHPAVRRALGPASPDELAARAVKGTRLADVAWRRKLWEGGKPAVEAALRDDPLLALARALDADSRAVRKRYEDEVEAVVVRASEELARARFEIHGTRVAPDATFTLRLSYGKVAGWTEDGKAVPPFTRLGGAFDRATGRDPFALPPRWLAAREKLDLATPFDFASTNDITGGNSGSPLFDRDLQIVGLAFDGNIWSLAGEYLYDGSRNRTVSVDSAAIAEALDRVYGARRLLDELLPPRRADR